MKSLRTVRYSLIAAAVAGSAVVSTPAFAEVTATAGVANLYLWRGQALGSGTPVVMGSLDYGHESGVFAGVWSSSGDTGFGTETDVYAGWGMSSDAFSFKVTAYDYSYPRTANPLVDGGGLNEIVISAGASGFFVDYIMGVDDLADTSYVDFGYTMDKVTAKFGMMMAEDVNGPDTDYSHLDVTYAYNKNLSFTLSGIAEAGDANTISKDPLVVVTYMLPLDLK